MRQMVQAAQDSICLALEELDGGRFRRDLWTRPEGGGGDTRVLQSGNVFEKAGVNISVVEGIMSAEALRSALGQGKTIPEGAFPFFATGLSLVIHPHNPMAPSVHANYRYFEVGNDPHPQYWWFGGGSDLSPAYFIREDAMHFHRVLKEVCDTHDFGFYARFKKWCDDYFYLPHRGEGRGIGGIFFDHLNDRKADHLFHFVSDCTRAFLPSYLPIVRVRKDMPFNEAQKHWQQIRRGRYVEFNLLYDRGTSFGLRTGGRTESILMSLPLQGGWQESETALPDSEEGKMLEVLRNPGVWV
jgi:coproporphyrinogen III oxidase